MIPMMYVSYNVARDPMLFGDQVMMRDLLEPHVEEIVGFNSNQEGAIVTMPLHQNQDYIDNLNADIRHLKWVIVILTANEFGSDAYKEIKHPNKKIYLTTPKQDDVADRFLPLGYPSIIKKPIVEKKYDWCFMGQVTNDTRRECVKELKKLPNGYLLETEGFSQGLPYDEYIEVMAQSKVVICPSGPATPDTYRVYEALQLGCIPIVDNGWYWHKIFDAPPITVVDNWEELPSLVQTEFDYLYRSTVVGKWWMHQKANILGNIFYDIQELRANI